MSNEVSRIPPAALRVGSLGPATAPAARSGPSAEAVSFATVLHREIASQEKVQFSAHARQRLSERGIRLDETDMARIGKAIDQAAAKGARQALLLSRDYALIVSVPNRTVVTAMDQSQMAERVVTNIDSTVLLA